MAGTITVNSTIQVTNSPMLTPTIGGSQTIVQNNLGGGLPGYTELGSADTAETLNTSELSTEGWAYVKNLSSDITVQLGLDVSSTFYPVMKLKPGEEFCFRLMDGITFQAKPISGTAKILVQVWED